MPSAPRLGVPLMDRDHAAIDLLFDAAATIADPELPALLDMIAEELHDHFAREEAMMAEARVPFLIQHFELHTQLLREIENMRREAASSDAASTRHLIGALLLRFVTDHVAAASAGRRRSAQMESDCVSLRDLSGSEAARLGAQLKRAPVDAIRFEGSASVADPGAALDASPTNARR